MMCVYFCNLIHTVKFFSFTLPSTSKNDSWHLLSFCVCVLECKSKVIAVVWLWLDGVGERDTTLVYRKWMVEYVHIGTQQALQWMTKSVICEPMWYSPFSVLVLFSPSFIPSTWSDLSSTKSGTLCTSFLSWVLSASCRTGEQNSLAVAQSLGWIWGFRSITAGPWCWGLISL